MAGKYIFPEGMVDQINNTLLAKALYSSKADTELSMQVYEDYLTKFWDEFDKWDDPSGCFATTPLAQPMGHSCFTISVTDSIKYILIHNSQNVITAYGSNNCLPTGFTK